MATTQGASFDDQTKLTFLFGHTMQADQDLTPVSRIRLMLCLVGSVVLGLIFVGQAQAGNLSDAASPYLKAHADDPIVWHPWGPQAFERARQNDNLIFLSIGYAACHWCHKLARDTFSDDRIVEALNANFISVLVDREERPDLDGYYMEIMQAMTGSSGWPGNFVLTADGVPLFAVGYVTPESEYGSPGLLEILQSLADTWQKNRAAVLDDLEITRSQLKDLFAPAPTGAASSRIDARDSTTNAWASAFDETYGGFGDSTKFLLPNTLSLLLGQGVKLRDNRLTENVYKTLDHMAAGGIRDQLRGTFHRYAVDRFWQVPHFEIMLSDNALLAHLYLEAFQVSKQPRYAEVAREILDDLLARFRLPAGGFASSLDSESQGKDGLFYTWTAEEVHSVLGPEEAEPFIKAYVDSNHGLVEGRSVLRLVDGPQSQHELRKRFASSLSRLRDARASETPPKRDDKVLTSWNALAVSAFAKAAQVLDDKRYRKVARETLAYLLATATDARNLRHGHHDGKATEAVFLDDYAFLIQALIDVYETEFDVNYLNHAETFMRVLIERFQDEHAEPFRFTTGELASNIPHRVILDEEGAPSGNAAALIALNRLILFGADAGFASQARSIQEALGRYLETSAGAAPALASVADYNPEEAHEIVIVGKLNEPDTQSLLREVYSRPLRGTVLSVISPDAPLENKKWPLLAGRPLLSDKATVYVCRKRLCDLPVDTPAQLSSRLDKLVSPETASTP